MILASSALGGWIVFGCVVLLAVAYCTYQTVTFVRIRRRVRRESPEAYDGKRKPTPRYLLVAMVIAAAMAIGSLICFSIGISRSAGHWVGLADLVGFVTILVVISRFRPRTRDAVSRR